MSKAMQDGGASSDAIAFYRLTGWFLSDLADTGGVQIGTIFTPLRANENSQTVLLGGVPPVVYIERAVPSEADFSKPIMAIKTEHPNALLWQSSPELDGIASSPQGGQRFVYRYRVLDGCHACEILGYVRVAFDFAPDGTYESARVLE